MVANAIAVILFVVGLFYLITSSLSLAASTEEGKALFQVLLGVLLIVVAAVIRFRHKLISRAERRHKSSDEIRRNPN